MVRALNKMTKAGIPESMRIIWPLQPTTKMLAPNLIYSTKPEFDSVCTRRTGVTVYVRGVRPWLSGEDAVWRHIWSQFRYPN